MDELNKVYVEPTNRCNLNCVTCIRHSWEEPLGDMEWPVYEALINGLEDFPGAKTIAFAGFGEPLFHERISEMIRFAHEQGLRTEMTSNAMLLTPSLAGRLPEQPLPEMWRKCEYTAFRERVRQFDFPPCTDCGGCTMAESNKEDCFDNPFPVCGDCLWARGVLRCA